MEEAEEVFQGALPSPYPKPNEAAASGRSEDPLNPANGVVDETPNAGEVAVADAWDEDNLGAGAGAVPTPRGVVPAVVLSGGFVTLIGVPKGVVEAGVGENGRFGAL